jgi:hypothetical protein
MNEIKTPIKTYGEVTIITEDHTISDVLRWLREQSCGDFVEIKTIIALMEEEDD